MSYNPQYIFSVIFCFFSFSLGIAQNKEKLLLIDNYLKQSDDSYFVSDHLKSLEYAKKACDLAKKQNSNQQIAKSSLYIASSLYAIGLNDIALKYTVEGRKYCDKDNYSLKAKLDNAEAYIFSDLGLYKNAISNYYKIIRALRKDQDPEVISQLFVVYQDLGTAYFNLKKQDSVKKYDRLAENLAPSLSKDAYTEIMVNFYYNQGGNYLDLGKRDSALIMYQKCEALESKDSARSFGLSYMGLANYYRPENPKNLLSII